MGLYSRQRTCGTCIHFNNSNVTCNLKCEVIPFEQNNSISKPAPADRHQCNTQRKRYSENIPHIGMIAAMDKNRAIGISGMLPFHLPSDLKHFKKQTKDSVLIMGRKTFDSLPGVLPGRKHWVISRSERQHINPEVRFFKNVADIIDAAMSLEKKTTVWVVGGGELYGLMMPYASEIVLSEVECEIHDADTFFPAITPGFMEVSREAGASEKNDQYSYQIVRYVSF